MTVHSFEDFDDLMKHLRKDIDDADRMVRPWQRDIEPGDYFAKWTRHGFDIYGEILREKEPRAKGLEHYRLCRAYSVACAQGEMGDIHVSTIDALISKDEFEDAKRWGWEP